MSRDSKNPSAFPYSGEGDEMNYSKGMSLRDYFAAKALQGMLADQTRDMYLNDFASAAYQYADAMLKARMK